MVDLGNDVSIMVGAWGQKPMIRRDVNNLIVALSREKVIELIHELTRDLVNSHVETQQVVVEFRTFYPKDRE